MFTDTDGVVYHLMVEGMMRCIGGGGGGGGGGVFPYPGSKIPNILINKCLNKCLPNEVLTTFL